jgi:peptidyl-prolyl cis-trans isomerase C
MATPALLRRARPPALLAAIGLGLLLSAWQGKGAEADPADAIVVAKVGAISISAADLARRMASIPPFQLRTFGETEGEIRRGFLERILVREALFAQGGADRKLDALPPVADKIRGVLRNALVAKIRAETIIADPVRPDEIKAYYDKNIARFHAPARVALWIIAVNSREDALAILDEIKKAPTPQRWTDLARERSVDKATSMRGGNLGFVSPDGSTNEPGLRVSRAVLDAAAKVRDTELVPEPVADGDRWIVAWRRQTMGAVNRPLEQEQGSIRQLLRHERTDEKIKEAVARLRKDHLAEHDPEQLALFEVTSGGELTPVRRPGSLPPGKHVNATPVPSPMPGGPR